MLVKVFIILGILFFLGGGSVGKGLGVAFRGCGCLIAIVALGPCWSWRTNHDQACDGGATSEDGGSA